jgi:hypothetical protein
MIQVADIIFTAGLPIVLLDGYLLATPRDAVLRTERLEIRGDSGIEADLLLSLSLASELSCYGEVRVAEMRHGEIQRVSRLDLKQSHPTQAETA